MPYPPSAKPTQTVEEPANKGEEQPKVAFGVVEELGGTSSGEEGSDGDVSQTQSAEVSIISSCRKRQYVNYFFGGDLDDRRSNQVAERLLGRPQSLHPLRCP